jgi:hypothetical protein
MPKNRAVVLCLLCLCSTVALADPTPHSRWSWTPLGYGIGERGFSALDVDGDGRAELFAVPRDRNYWYELRRDGLFRQTWTSFLEETTFVALDSIGTPSGARIALLDRVSLRIFDASSKVALLRIVTATTSSADVALGDLDSNGVLDAVVCDADTLYRYELATGSQTGVRHGFGCSDVAIGQIDTDPQLEIAIAGNQTGGYVLDGLTLAVEWGDLEGFGERIALGDLDGDGRDEILAASDFDYDARALDPETDTELWRVSRDSNPSAFLVADLDPSPGSEAIVKSVYSDISVLVGATGALIRTHPFQASSVSQFAAADTDGDGDLELLWGADACCYSSSLWVLEGGSNVVSKAADDTNSLGRVCGGRVRRRARQGGRCRYAGRQLSDAGSGRDSRHGAGSGDPSQRTRRRGLCRRHHGLGRHTARRGCEAGDLHRFELRQRFGDLRRWPELRGGVERWHLRLRPL